MRSSNELFEELQIECESNQTFRDLKPAERLSLKDNLEIASRHDFQGNRR